jgi:exocyst complex component 2
VTRKAGALIHLYQSSAGTTSRRSPSQVKGMALDIVKLYIALLSEFFVLSDMAASMSSATLVPPPLFPTHSNSLTTAHYLMKILGEIQDAMGEVDAMDISSEAAGGMRSLIESTRWKFVDVLIHAWQRGRRCIRRKRSSC